MTRILLGSENGSLHLIMSGHAGYASDKGYPEGCDIVCAALSVVASMAMQRMCEMKEEGKLRDLKMARREGSVLINAACTAGAERELEATARTIESGFELLADSYPENVRLVRGGGNGGEKEVC